MNRPLGKLSICVFGEMVCLGLKLDIAGMSIARKQRWTIVRGPDQDRKGPLCQFRIVGGSRVPSQSVAGRSVGGAVAAEWEALHIRHHRRGPRHDGCFA
jgi:hypothetical protein